VWGFEILLLPSLYQWLMVGARGQTLGKMALGVRVARAEDAGPVGYPRARSRPIAWCRSAPDGAG
jgi:uncharacterized RDD family membrane protein YckC